MQIDWWTLAIQTVNFLIVVWLLRRFLYRPVRRVIEQREAAGREIREKAVKAEAEAEAARLEYERKRSELDEAQRVRETELHAVMEKERETLLAAARAEADDMLADARARIERERDETVRALRDRIAGLALDLAKAALSDGAGAPEDDLRRVDDFLDALSPADRDELSRDLADEGCTLVVVSAGRLSEGLKDRWGTTLRGCFGGGVRLSFEEDPEILGGVELRFPHSVISFSVADRLHRAAEGVKG